MTESKTELEPTQQRAVVPWQGENISITFHDVKTLICPDASPQEIVIFLKTCESLKLNPFAGECYLIKYSEREKAAMVIAIDAYLKSAEGDPNYDGCEAGIILAGPSGNIQLREGAFLLESEREMLAGGWAKVYRKDRGRPTYVAVNKRECIKTYRDGKPTQFWTPEKQPWMLRKTAMKRALVEAFPSLFAGTMSTAEVGEGMEEGTMPGFLERDGEPDWPKFWAKVKSELGYTQKQVREKLEVSSIKKDLIGQGVTMEQIWNVLVDEHFPTQQQDNVVDGETGEVLTPERMQTEQADPEPELDRDIFPEDDGEVGEAPEADSRVDMNWLRESLQETGWHDVGKWIRNRYKNATGKKVRELVESLTPEQQEEFVQQVQDRLEIHRSQHQKKG